MGGSAVGKPIGSPCVGGAGRAGGCPDLERFTPAAAGFELISSTLPASGWSLGNPLMQMPLITLHLPFSLQSFDFLQSSSSTARQYPVTAVQLPYSAHRFDLRHPSLLAMHLARDDSLASAHKPSSLHRLVCWQSSSFVRAHAPSLRLQRPLALQPAVLRQSASLASTHAPFSFALHRPSVLQSSERWQASSVARHRPSTAAHCPCIRHIAVRSHCTQVMSSVALSFGSRLLRLHPRPSSHGMWRQSSPSPALRAPSQKYAPAENTMSARAPTASSVPLFISSPSCVRGTHVRNHRSVPKVGLEHKPARTSPEAETGTHGRGRAERDLERWLHPASCGLRPSTRLAAATRSRGSAAARILMLR